MRIALILLCLSFSVVAWSQGDLMVFPKRIIFDGSSRAINLNLANIGSDTARYALSFVQYRMTEIGKFEEITTPEPGQLFADSFLRFFPRSVTLAPNESQIVKVQLTKANLLQPGEYRSHIYFRSLPKPTPLKSEETTPVDGGISIQLTPVFGITIPAIIRNGASTTTLTITNISKGAETDSSIVLNMDLNRSGNMSVYGNLTIDYITPKGISKRVGFIQGLAVYTPNLLRHVGIAINKKGVDFQTGKLHFEFSEVVNLKPVKRAELEIQLP
jgi:hypothetical protein